MPELPEVETTRQGLVPVLAGRTVASVEVLHPRMLRRQPDPADFAARLRGKMVGELGRRGKFLLIEVGDGLTWVFHLGMSGRMSITDRAAPRNPHTRVVVRTDAGHEVRMVDPRTFGFTAVKPKVRGSTILTSWPASVRTTTRVWGFRGAARSVIDIRPDMPR